MYTRPRTFIYISAATQYKRSSTLLSSSPPPSCPSKWWRVQGTCLHGPAVASTFAYGPSPQQRTLPIFSWPQLVTRIMHSRTSATKAYPSYVLPSHCYFLTDCFSSSGSPTSHCEDEEKCPGHRGRDSVYPVHDAYLFALSDNGIPRTTACGIRCGPSRRTIASFSRLGGTRNPPEQLWVD